MVKLSYCISRKLLILLLLYKYLLLVYFLNKVSFEYGKSFNKLQARKQIILNKLEPELQNNYITKAYLLLQVE